MSINIGTVICVFPKSRSTKRRRPLDSTSRITDLLLSPMIAPSISLIFQRSRQDISRKQKLDFIDVPSDLIDQILIIEEFKGFKIAVLLIYVIFGSINIFFNFNKNFQFLTLISLKS